MPKSDKPPRAKKEAKPKKAVEKKPKEKKEKKPKPSKKPSHNVEFGNDVHNIFNMTESPQNMKISKQSVQLVSDIVQNIENRIIDVAFETCATVEKKMKLVPEHLKAATLVVLPRDLGYYADKLGVQKVNDYVA